MKTETESNGPDRGIDFDVARLDEYLKGWLGGVHPTRVERTHGGMSNPTYFVTRGEWRAVLRKQPNNVLMPSAHAIDREYRVLTALQGSAVPTPKPYSYCEDHEIVGTPFYLMECGWTAVSSTTSRRLASRAASVPSCFGRCAPRSPPFTNSIIRRSGWATSASPETISPASSIAGRSSGRSSAAATTTTQPWTGWCIGLPSGCPKARPSRFATAISASLTRCSTKKNRTSSACSTGSFQRSAILWSILPSTVRPGAWRRTRTEDCSACRSMRWAFRPSTIILNFITNCRAQRSG